MIARSDKVFVELQRFSYIDDCNPNDTFIEKLKNFRKLLFTKMYYNQYYTDLKNYLGEKEVSEENRKKAKFILTFDKLLSSLVYIYIPFSLYSHYKKGFFKTGNYLVELYIVGKICFVSLSILGIIFFVTKNNADKLLYPYYYKKELEWENIREKLKADKEYHEEFIRIRK
jgi:hypothetical protein